MAYGGADGQTKQARMLQEAVKGKITEGEAQQFLNEADGVLDYAANVALSQDDKPGLTYLTREEVLRDLHSRFENVIKTRLFACGPCDRSWWRKVPSRKQVSKCRTCHTKLNAVSRDKEWGWCKYVCECGHEFNGFGSKENPADSPCYKCGRQCFPTEVLPPRRRDNNGRRTRNTHSCTGANCCNRTGGYNKGECPHPKSRRQKVLVSSTVHTSTGSTVATFLSQGSLKEFESDLFDIAE